MEGHMLCQDVEVQRGGLRRMVEARVPHDTGMEWLKHHTDTRQRQQGRLRENTLQAPRTEHDVPAVLQNQARTLLLFRAGNGRGRRNDDTARCPSQQGAVRCGLQHRLHLYRRGSAQGPL